MENSASKESLKPAYKNVALDYIVLHDTAHRMLERGVIEKIVDFSESREFFFWNFACRIELNAIFKSLIGQIKGIIPKSRVMNSLNDSYKQILSQNGLNMSTYSEELFNFIKSNKTMIEKSTFELLKNEISKELNSIQKILEFTSK